MVSRVVLEDIFWIVFEDDQPKDRKEIFEQMLIVPIKSIDVIWYWILICQYLMNHRDNQKMLQRLPRWTFKCPGKKLTSEYQIFLFHIVEEFIRQRVFFLLNNVLYPFSYDKTNTKNLLQILTENNKLIKICYYLLEYFKPIIEDFVPTRFKSTILQSLHELYYLLRAINCWCVIPSLKRSQDRFKFLCAGSYFLTSNKLLEKSEEIQCLFSSIEIQIIEIQFNSTTLSWNEKFQLHEFLKQNFNKHKSFITKEEKDKIETLHS